LGLGGGEWRAGEVWRVRGVGFGWRREVFLGVVVKGWRIVVDISRIVGREGRRRSDIFIVMVDGEEINCMWFGS